MVLSAYYSDAVSDILGPFGYSPPSASDRSLVAPRYSGGIQLSKALLRTLTGDGLWTFGLTSGLQRSQSQSQDVNAMFKEDGCYAEVAIDHKRRAVSLPRVS